MHMFASLRKRRRDVSGTADHAVARKLFALSVIAGNNDRSVLYFFQRRFKIHGDLMQREPFSQVRAVRKANALLRNKIVLHLNDQRVFALQREFIPETEPLMDEHNQSETMKTVIGSAFSAGRSLAQSQIPFVWADYLALQDASFRNGKIVIGGHEFGTLVIPRGVTLPASIKSLVSEAAGAGMEVIRVPKECTAEFIRESIHSEERFEPALPQLVYGKFTRDGRTIYLVLNSSESDYEGTLSVAKSGTWRVLDPDSGEINAVKTSDAGLPVSLKPLQTLIYVL